MENNSNNSSHWYALYTHSRAEKKVHEQMQAAGIEVYLPLKRELHQWSDRKKWVESPIINSYIFARFCENSLNQAYQFRGIVAFVNNHGKPAIITNAEMDAMKRTVENKLAFTIEQNTLRKGETIRMTSGPLEGIEGEVMEVKGQTRLHLRVTQIGYSLVVDISNFTFEKVLN
jgi:transcriptional antiterminator RfaH